nr:hypothetical protein [Tanacetum cinerariifolium]
MRIVYGIIFCRILVGFQQHSAPHTVAVIVAFSTVAYYCSSTVAEEKKIISRERFKLISEQWFKGSSVDMAESNPEGAEWPTQVDILEHDEREETLEQPETNEHENAHIPAEELISNFMGRVKEVTYSDFSACDPPYYSRES